MEEIRVYLQAFIDFIMRILAFFKRNDDTESDTDSQIVL